MKRIREKMKYYDVLSVVICAVVFVFFFVRVRYGINRVDESFYLTVAQRFARGERPLVDEWQLSQLSDLFLVPFYRLFVAVTGGTEGIILFMRQVFLIANLVFYWILYGKLRTYRIWGLMATAVVSFYIPWAMFTLNYYTMAPRLLTLICLLLMFGKRKPGKIQAALSGVLLSAAVLIAPPLAILYVVYSIAVLGYECAKKRHPEHTYLYSFLCNRRVWTYMTISITVCAAVFLTFLHLRSGLQNVIAALPDLLTDSEYDFSADGNVRSFLLSKLPKVAEIFGWGPLAAAVLLCVATVVYTRRSSNKNGRLWLFLASNLLLLSFCLAPFVAAWRYNLEFWDYWYYYIITPVPLYAFGLVNYLLCKRKEPRLFVAWIAGLLASVLMDSFSDVSFSICGTLAALPGFLCFGQLVQELSEESFLKKGQKSKKAKDKSMFSGGQLSEKGRRIFQSVSVVALALFLVWECSNVFFEGSLMLAEQEQGENAEIEKLEQGIYRGVYTSHDIATDYAALLDDLSYIKNECDGIVYLDIPYPPAFLTLNQFSANCSSWNSSGDRLRQLRYLSMHPEKAPDVLYYLTNDFFFKQSASEKEKTMFEAYASLLCDGTVIRGKQGIIVKVQRWKGPETSEMKDWLDMYSGGF